MKHIFWLTAGFQSKEVSLAASTGIDAEVYYDVNDRRLHLGDLNCQVQYRSLSSVSVNVTPKLFSDSVTVVGRIFFSKIR